MSVSGLSSTARGIGKMGQVKISLFTNEVPAHRAPHLHGFNYCDETGEEIPTVAVRPADVQVKEREQRCEVYSFTSPKGACLADLNMSHGNAHLYEITLGSLQLICCEIMFIVYAFMHGLLSLFTSFLKMFLHLVDAVVPFMQQKY